MEKLPSEFRTGLKMGALRISPLCGKAVEWPNPPSLVKKYMVWFLWGRKGRGRCDRIFQQPWMIRARKMRRHALRKTPRVIFIASLKRGEADFVKISILQSQFFKRRF